VIPLALASALGFGIFLCVAHRKNMRHKKALTIASGESTPVKTVMREVRVERRLTL
jgi:glutamine amidotransferase PdxT